MVVVAVAVVAVVVVVVVVLEVEEVVVVVVVVVVMSSIAVALAFALAVALVVVVVVVDVLVVLAVLVDLVIVEVVVGVIIVSVPALKALCSLAHTRTTEPAGQASDFPKACKQSKVASRASSQIRVILSHSSHCSSQVASRDGLNVHDFWCFRVCQGAGVCTQRVPSSPRCCK